jgi:hypothetical protein
VEAIVSPWTKRPMSKMLPLLFALIPLAAVATAYVVAP